MDTATKNLADLIKSKGMAISVISKATGKPYDALWASLSGSRPMRADEFLAVCCFVGVDPMSLRAD